MAGIEIRGMDAVVEKIKTLDDLKPAKTALLAAGAHIKGKINRYPPATEANQPRGFNQYYGPGRRALNTWYQRGYGTKRVRKDGTVIGMKISETLGRRWTVEARDRGLTVAVGNNVTYAPFVHDPEDQASFHAARGWKTTQQVADEESAAVVRFIESEIDRAMK